MRDGIRVNSNMTQACSKVMELYALSKSTECKNPCKVVS